MSFARTTALMALVASASCSNQGDKCSEAWGRPAADGQINLLQQENERVRFTDVETHLIAEVDRCYRRKNPKESLRFTQECRDKRGHRYLEFDIVGTSDIAFVAVVDRSGSIIQVGRSSTQ
jgi:hypothetical protein